ncbi:MAG TPA: DUF418 domain-containing protein, partial [Flavobacterium sp.]
MKESAVLPIETGQRSDILDILRGFALLGICIANSGYFSMYIFQSEASRASMPFPLIDQWLKYFHIAFVDGKFYSIFSMLFGIGFAIIIYSKEGLGNKLTLFYRRLFILFAFGLAHAILIWDGDILMFYALSGMFLPLFRKFRPRTLLIVATVLLFSPLLFDWVKVWTNNDLNMSNPLLKLALEQDKQSGITEQSLHNWLIVNNTYQDILAWNRSGFWWSWQMRIDGNRIQKIFAMFLIGLAVGQMKLYCRIEEFKPLLKRIMVWSLVVGTIAGIAKVFFETDEVSLPKPGGLFDTLTYALNVAPLALGYCLVIALMHNSNNGNKVFEWMKPVGRMALTNYILQTVICISIYYGIGLGLASRVGPSFFIPMAVFIFLLQVVYSRIWLSYFNFGPL